jgi:hypothetical protein
MARKAKEKVESISTRVRQFLYEKDCYWVGWIPYKIIDKDNIVPLNGLGCEKEINLLKEKLKL